MKGSGILNILIVDNDEKFIKKLEKDIFNYFSEDHEEINFNTYSSEFLNINYNKKYDYIFLDIDLHEKFNGINIAFHLIESHSEANIVFVSSHVNYIHDTMFLRPFYFIRKIEYEKDIHSFFDMIERNIQLNQEINVNYKGERNKINVNKIIMIEGQGHQLQISTHDKVYFDNRSLKYLLNILPKERFVQVHKGYIINLNYLLDYTTKTVKLSNGMEINVGRSYKDYFLQCVREYILR